MIMKRQMPLEVPPAPAFSAGTANLQLGEALDIAAGWPTPVAIVVDGPYGVSGFPGDPPTVAGLPDWYEPHINLWSEKSGPDTTLWFWGTELSWAVVHPILEKHDWEYRGLHIWDKGIGQVAGNVNSNTIRRFPVVTEVCGQYTKVVRLPTDDNQQLTLQDWLRYEWRRTGLPMYKANEAAGVKNAATRKYLTGDHLWYSPPPDIMEQIAAWANTHGAPTDRPYFSLNGKAPLTAGQWGRLRSKWNHKHGVTNVWQVPSVRGAERLKGPDGFAHTNQKPLRLMELTIEACTDIGDIVWEPFGGLCSASVAAMELQRPSYAAEIDEGFFCRASERLAAEAALLIASSTQPRRARRTSSL